MKNFFKDPFVHFFLIGAFLFFIYEIINPSIDSNERVVVVNSGQILSLKAKFEKTWKRSPEPQELQALVDNYVLDEVYYRQALALGIEKNDPLIRKRLRQKMEFLTNVSEGSPAEDEIQSFYQENAALYKTEDKYSLKQIFINTDAQENLINERILNVKEALNAGEDVKGDSSFFPEEFDLATKKEISRHLGEAFYKQLADLPEGEWLGPIKSGMGLHFVYVERRLIGMLPKLQEVQDIVIKDWQYQEALNQRELINKRLLTDYIVDIEWPEGR